MMGEWMGMVRAGLSCLVVESGWSALYRKYGRLDSATPDPITSKRTRAFEKPHRCDLLLDEQALL